MVGNLTTVCFLVTNDGGTIEKWIGLLAEPRSGLCIRQTS